MGFEKDLQDELRGRLSAESSEPTLEGAIIKLQSATTEEDKIRAAEHVLNLRIKFGNEINQKGQFRNAAYQYFEGANVVRYYLNDKAKENQLLTTAADLLVKSAHEYVAWKDLLGGAVCITIAALLRIRSGNWDLKSFLDPFVNTTDFSGNQEAVGCLYIPYDIVKALNKDSPDFSLFQRAINYSESYLVNSTAAAMFQDGIRDILNESRTKVMELIKYPRFRAKYSYDQDIVYGETFTFTIFIENIGEGVGTGITAKISFPKFLQNKSNTETIKIEKLDPSENKEVSFNFVCPTGEGKTELTAEISTVIEFEDILKNRNSINVGSAYVIIRAEKKADKLLNQLSMTKLSLIQALKPIGDSKSEEPKNVSNSIASVILKIEEDSKKDVENGDFTSAEARITSLGNFNGIIEKIAKFFIDYDQLTHNYKDVVSELLEKSSSILSSIDEINNS